MLVNMASSRSEARAVQQRISSVARRFLDATVYDAGYVLRDEHVAAAVRRRQPFVLAYPRCQASYCVANLAAKIARGVGATRQETGFFRRVANWFF